MYARVVRFTDVDPDHLAGRLAEAEAREGPPVDIPAKGVQILHDAGPAHRDRDPALRDGRRHGGCGGRPRLDGPGGHAGDARLDRPLRDQGRAESRAEAPPHLARLGHAD